MRMMVQYWRSFAHLEAFARDPDRAHWPAWAAFNRANRQAREDVGIWHETYLVPAGAYEAVYSGMPLTGLARAAGWAPVTARNDGARLRLETAAAPDGGGPKREGRDPPAPPSAT
jgi:hypothetical protein